MFRAPSNFCLPRPSSDVGDTLPLDLQGAYDGANGAGGGQVQDRSNLAVMRVAVSEGRRGDTKGEVFR
jgi:hypothetical protein